MKRPRSVFVFVFVVILLLGACASRPPVTEPIPLPGLHANKNDQWAYMWTSSFRSDFLADTVTITKVDGQSIPEQYLPGTGSQPILAGLVRIPPGRHDLVLLWKEQIPIGYVPPFGEVARRTVQFDAEANRVYAPFVADDNSHAWYWIEDWGDYVAEMAPVVGVFTIQSDGTRPVVAGEAPPLTAPQLAGAEAQRAAKIESEAQRARVAADKHRTRVALAPTVQTRGANKPCAPEPDWAFDATVDELENVMQYPIHPPEQDHKMTSVWIWQGNRMEKPSVEAVVASEVFADADAVMLISFGLIGKGTCLRVRYDIYLVDKRSKQMMHRHADYNTVRDEMAHMLRDLDRT